MLALEDLKDYSEEEVKEYLINSYSGDRDDYRSSEDVLEQDKVRVQLKDCEVLIAYESVGAFGCDSSSMFLFRKDNTYYCLYGSHDSTSGFEGQFDMDPISLIYLQSDKFHFPKGGYDESNGDNELAVKNYLAELCPACGKHIPNKEERLVHLDWEMEQNKYIPEVS